MKLQSILVDGILVIDKPAGITSHDVVARVRRILKTKRVGHTGTLDPFATGVLVVLVGKATRLARFVDKDEKEYEAVVRFGSETDTGDATGSRSTESGMRAEELSRILAEAEWNNVLSAFRGEIDQIPPMYSAKKVGGRKLYEHARKGETVARTPASVTIGALEMLAPSNPHVSDLEIRLRVVCSAGTYVRVLAEDIGRAVGVGAHLQELRRTRAGRFCLEQSNTLDQIADMKDPAVALLPMELAVEHLPEIVLSSDRVDKTRAGLASRVPDTAFTDGQLVRMHGPDGELLAIGIHDSAEGCVRPRVVLI